MQDSTEKKELLEAELERLRRRMVEVKLELEDLTGAQTGKGVIVDVPEELQDTFNRAKSYVSDYFASRWEDPHSARIVVSGERYILVRAASMSIELYNLVRSLYRDRGAIEADSVARSLLFDVGHSLGKADAAAFHERMGVRDPLEKLSAGPVHFAYTGWALVEIHVESAPSPDESFFLYYDHPNSFEADAWLDRGEKADFPICVMNAGYSSGWCEQSYGIPLVAAEITCRARGDACCRFVMAPPSRIQDHIDRMHTEGLLSHLPGPDRLDVPEFFRRKRLEDELRRAHDDLERRVAQRTAELKQRNEDLEAANQRLAELHRAREEFLAMISHELRTPLVTGLGYVDLAVREKLGPLSDQLGAGMQVALRNLKRLSGLVDEILRYHQLSHRGHQAALIATVDLEQICKDSIEDLLVRTGRKRGSVLLEVDRNLPPVLADADMILQVLSNLLNNANHHGGPDATITLSLRRVSESAAQVEVHDDGVGMSPQLLRQATEPFVRASSEGSGLGLGLAITRALLTANGSELTLRSTEGEGTSATFILPLDTTAAPEPDPQSSLRKTAEGAAEGDCAPRGSRVLVVEDDKDTRSFLQVALAQHGFDVLAVVSAEDGLDRLDGFPADVMLVDLGLPGMNGLELVRRIKSRPEHIETPIFLFTARAEDRVRREAMAAGCRGTLVKPVAVEDLLHHLDQAVGIR